MHKIGVHIGKRVHELRKAANMTQDQLADTAQVPQGNISRLERGDVEDIRVSTLLRLARSLRTTVDDLLRGFQDEAGFSDTWFQRTCMDVSSRYPMKVLHTPGVLNRHIQDGREARACPLALRSTHASSSVVASWRSAVSQPAVHQPSSGASRAWASARVPCCCHSRARLMAARRSRAVASWRRATSRAWCTQASASSGGPLPGAGGLGSACLRSSAPRRRCRAAAASRSPVCSTRTSASASAARPASGWPRRPAASASMARTWGRCQAAPVAGDVARPGRICPRPAGCWSWTTMAQPCPRAHPGGVATVIGAWAGSRTAGPGRRTWCRMVSEARARARDKGGARGGARGRAWSLRGRAGSGSPRRPRAYLQEPRTALPRSLPASRQANPWCGAGA